MRRIWPVGNQVHVGLSLIRQILKGKMMIRIFVLLVSLISMTASHAQDWPARPVRIIVNIAAGGVADVVARLTASVLAESLKQPFVVDNRAGGDGYIGFEAAARAEPDGYTLVFSPGAYMMMSPHLVQRKDFDPLEMLTPIAPAISSTLYFVVPVSFPARNVAEFIAYAKSNPGKINYGTAGTGSIMHFATELFKRDTQIQATHVPYKGVGPALNDLLGGVFQFMFASGPGLAQVKAGKLRLLAVSTVNRHRDFPDVPTFAELGFKDIDGGPLFGFYSPKGMSPAIAQRLNAEITKAIYAPETRRRLDAIGGVEPVQMTPDQFAAYVRAESNRYGKLFRDFGINKE